VISKKAGGLGRDIDAEVLDLNLYSLDAEVEDEARAEQQGTRKTKRRTN
jgi:hypothetical protein